MKQTPYRFETYADADFPVYASSPENRKFLVFGHYHQDAEINKVIRGTVQVNVGTATYTLKAGDIIFFSPLSMHEIISETENAAIWGFVFDTRLLGESVDFTSVRDTHFLFPKGTAQHAEAEGVFDSLHALYREKPPTFRLRTTAGLLLFASLLTESGFLPPGADGQSTMRTAPVIQYIRENFRRELSIRELAKILHLCSDAFIRVFKAEHGQTPLAYIQNLRICEALRLLSENQHSISEIASQTGFSSTSYFIKTFKSRLGAPPAKYRKEHFSGDHGRHA